MASARRVSFDESPDPIPIAFLSVIDWVDGRLTIDHDERVERG